MSNTWKPIAPPTEADLSLSFPENDSLITPWREFRGELTQFHPAELKKFLDKLLRAWSIETGIIERLYDVDEGTTKTLVEQGFLVDLIDHAASNVAPETLISILKDQRNAAEMVMDAAEKRRNLSPGLLCELHAVLTSHQDYATGLDQFGNEVDIPLEKGVFKKWENNPTRSDGTIHRYCPPLQVTGEIERLSHWFDGMDTAHPIVKAAWLHHRFTEIHPFQDGNGRVARCLVTLVLLREDRLPIVVRRQDRDRYIHALEAADGGDLQKLAQLFAELERSVLMRALSISGVQEINKTYEGDLVQKVAFNLAAAIRARKDRERQILREVDTIAERLLPFAGSEVLSLLWEAATILRENAGVNLDVMPALDYYEGGTHLAQREHYFRRQIIDAQSDLGYWINFSEAHYWIKRVVRSQTSRMEFIVAFHHIGRQLTGVMAAACLAQVVFDTDEHVEVQKQAIPCMTSDFSFTYKDDLIDVQNRLKDWIAECFAVALQEWGSSL